MPASWARVSPSAIWMPRSRSLFRGQGPRGHHVTEGTSLDQLHGDPGRAAVGADVVDGHHVGMVEGRSGQRLLLEAAPSLGAARKLLGQHLQGHVAAELGVQAMVPKPFDLDELLNLVAFHSG